MTLREEVEKKLLEAQTKIGAILQIFHDETNLIPYSIDFDPIDIRLVEDFGNRNKVLISNVRIYANT